ncbi:MAG: DUF1854 domain-containing protein [Bacillota bacterium]
MALTEQAKDLNILDPENVELSINEEQEVTLRLKKENKARKNVEINPAFPLSKIGRYLSITEESEDNKKLGEEIGMIKDIDELDKQSKKVIEQALDKIYFIPKITKIYEIEEEFGVTRWEVETQKGSRAFDIKSRRKDVRPYGNGRIIIHDIDGNRYEITDHRELDDESKEILKSEI